MIASPWNPDQPLLAPLLLGATRFLVGGHAYWIGAKPTPAQRIYFANHTSNLDTVVIWSALPPMLRARTHPVAAADYWGGSKLRRHVAIDVLGAVLIDRKRATEGDPLAPLYPTLDAGESLIIFPEGGRGAERLPGTFKSGLYNLAKRYPKVELVPTYLENIARAFPKGALFPAPIGCSVRFGTPVRLGGSEERGDFLTRARDALCALAAPKDDPTEIKAAEREAAKAMALKDAASREADETASREAAGRRAAETARDDWDGYAVLEEERVGHDTQGARDRAVEDARRLADEQSAHETPRSRTATAPERTEDASR